MAIVQSATTRALTKLESVFTQVGAELAHIGLSMSVWDTASEPVSPKKTSNEFCEYVCGKCPHHDDSVSALVRGMLEEGTPATGQTHLGCCLLTVPIMQRRRLLGAAVACFPAREMLEEERLARLCDSLELDRQAIQKLGKTICRHSRDEAADLLHVFEWLLERAQNAKTAEGELKTLSTNLATTYEELNLLYQISGSMRVTQRPEEFIRNACNELVEVTHSSVAAIIYAHPPAVEEDIVVSVGQTAMSPTQLKDLAASVISPRLARSSGPIVDNDFMEQYGDERAVRNIVAVPLSAGAAQVGMLIGFNKDGDFDTVDMKLLNSIGNQTAVFLANNRLYADLQDLLMGVLHALTSTIDAKDPYTSGHSQRVALLSRKIAQACDLPPAQVERIYLSGLLHDIGKLATPEAVLCKPGKLTDAEFDIIKNHPARGAQILGGIRQLDDVIPGILMHHERLDGRGYPQNLRGDELPLAGRIVCLADCFDAMTSDRTYRKALPLETVIKEIRDHAGTQFDSDLVAKFLEFDLEACMEELRQPVKTVFPISPVEESSI